MFAADVPDEMAGWLGKLEQDGLLTVPTPWGEFSLAVAPDSAVLAEAGRLLPRHLASFTGQPSAYQSHLIYWLRVAADVAHREGS
jgi:hypothetical protein